MPFIKAARVNVPLRVCLAGVGGTGKTMTALLAARELVGDKPIGIIDTEQGSAQLYADRIPGGFEVLRLDRAGPAEMVSALDDATKAGLGVVVLDSASAEWNGPGGCLELADSLGKFKGWASVTPLHNRFLDAVRGYPGHVILTCRRKVDYQVNPGGAPKKVGLTLVQRDGFEYEMDAVVVMEGKQCVIEKSRLEAPLSQDAVIAREALPKALYAVAHRKSS